MILITDNPSASENLTKESCVFLQEALKRPMKQKRKLRIFISNTFYAAKEPGPEGTGEEGSVASWELRVEGRLLEDSKSDPNKVIIVEVNLILSSKQLFTNNGLIFSPQCYFVSARLLII